MELKEAIAIARSDDEHGEAIEVLIAAAESLLAGVSCKVEYSPAFGMTMPDPIEGNPFGTKPREHFDAVIVRLPAE